jgi:hypothetical protein
VVALGVTGMLLMASAAQAQDAPAAAAQPAQADPLAFDGTHPAMILLQIKEPAEASFVESMNKMKAMLAASTNPKAQSLGNGLEIFKLNVPASVQDPAAGPVFVYLLQMDQPVAGQSYNPLQIFYYSEFFLPLDEKGQPAGTPEDRKKVDDVYNPIVAAVASIVPWPLIKK